MKKTGASSHMPVFFQTEKVVWFCPKTGHFFDLQILMLYKCKNEGEIIDVLHDERHWAEGIIINAGAYSHYSYAIRDAIEAINIHAVEVHISDIQNRENFRKKTVIGNVCLDTISGLGKNSYLEGLKILLKKNIHE